MSHLGRHLSEHSEEIIDRWYRVWKDSDHPHSDVPEDLLRDHLSEQLRIIGHEMQSSSPDLPEKMWEITERLQPEDRVEQQIPIEEEVLSYKILVSVVREWVEEHEIDVPSPEYAFFYEAVFELVAESMKRYTRYREEQLREGRAQYVAAITHQMKTPISTLSMAMQLISEDQVIESEVLGSMRRAVRRLDLLAGGLMRLERFRVEELPVRPTSILIQNLCEEILTHHHFPARERGINLIAEVEPDLQITADHDLMVDAIDNLVQNAIRHGGGDSVLVRALRDDQHVVIEVIDHGPGIPPDRQKELFTPVDPGSGGGAGIGLTIARRAVVAQSGDIGFESEPGSGCRFWIRLPSEVSSRS